MKKIKQNNKTILSLSISEINKQAALHKKQADDLQPPEGLPSFEEVFGAEFKPDPYVYFREQVVRRLKTPEAIQKALEYIEQKSPDIEPSELRKTLWNSLSEALDQSFKHQPGAADRYRQLRDFWQSQLLNPSAQAAQQTDEPAASGKAPWGELHTDVEDIQAGEPFEMEFAEPNQSRNIQDWILDFVNQKRKEIQSNPKLNDVERKKMLADLDVRQKDMFMEFAKATVRIVKAQNGVSLHLNKKAWEFIGLCKGWPKTAQAAPATKPATKPTTKPATKPSPKPQNPDPMRPGKVDPAPAKALTTAPAAAAPATKPATNPATKPATKPNPRPQNPDPMRPGKVEPAPAKAKGF
jgi:hypothetical protein